jgi:2-dehydropantoate 2-reductase
MRIAVLGAGAIGGLVGGLLARSGSDVSLIARGDHLAAIRRDGLRVLGLDSDIVVRDPATGDPAEVGAVDVVVLGLKAYSYGSCGPLIEPLLGPGTTIVAAQNGIPWWYFYGHGGPHDGHRLESVDPGGSVSAVLPPSRVTGCVPYPAAEVAQPGVIRHLEGWQFPDGEPDRSHSDRGTRFADAMTAAGFRSRLSDVRSQIWLKLMGNAAFNPVSALTGATMAQVCQYPATRSLVARVMQEVLEVAAGVGAPPPSQFTVERRLSGAERVGQHKTSMLQDLESGKPLETAALLTSVIEIADLVGVATPSLRAIAATVDLMWRTRARRLRNGRRQAGSGYYGPTPGGDHHRADMDAGDGEQILHRLPASCTCTRRRAIVTAWNRADGWWKVRHWLWYFDRNRRLLADRHRAPGVRPEAMFRGPSILNAAIRRNRPCPTHRTTPCRQSCWLALRRAWRTRSRMFCVTWSSAASWHLAPPCSRFSWRSVLASAAPHCAKRSASWSVMGCCGYQTAIRRSRLSSSTGST